MNVPLRPAVKDTVFPLRMEVVAADGVEIVTVCAERSPVMKRADRKNEPFKRVKFFIAQSFMLKKEILNSAAFAEMEIRNGFPVEREWSIKDL